MKKDYLPNYHSILKSIIPLTMLFISANFAYAQTCVTGKTYNIYAYYRSAEGHCTDASYLIYGNAPAVSPTANQSAAPTDFTFGGKGWKLLATSITPNTAGNITIKLRPYYSTCSGGFILADAILLVDSYGRHYIIDNPQGIASGTWTTSTNGDDFNGTCRYVQKNGSITTTTEFTWIFNENAHLTDSDGDGIIDECDLDDDNDGILDTTEGCSTVANTNEQNGTFGTLASGTRDLVVNPGNGYAYVGNLNAEGRYVVVAHNNVANVHASTHFDHVYGHTTGAANDAFLAVNGSNSVGVFYKQNLNLPPTANITFGLWAMSGVTPSEAGSFPFNIGIRIQDPTGAIVAQTSTGSITATTWQNANLTFTTTGYTDYSVVVYNISTSISGNDFCIDDIYVHASVPVCNLDTDGDGTPDYLDLDSDNDGCPDALEGTRNFKYSDLNQNTSLVGPISASGIPKNGLSQGDVSSKNASVKSAECDFCNSASSLFTDTDADGIGDNCDSDDDNDGILDTVEGICVNQSVYTFSVAETLAGQSSLPVNGGTIPLKFVLTSGSGIPNIGGAGINTYFIVNLTVSDFNNTYSGVNHAWDGLLTTNDGLAIVPNETTFYTGLLSPNKDKVLFSTQNFINISRQDLFHKFLYYGFFDNLGTFSLSTGNLPVLPTNYTITNSNIELYNYFNLASVSDGYSAGYFADFVDQQNLTGGTDVNYTHNFYPKFGKTYNLIYTAFGNGGATTTNRGLVTIRNGSVTICQSLDSDGDKIPDYLDLDSDNDGCPDAIEGAGNIQYNQLASNSGISGGVGANGIPTAVGSGQSIGTSRNASVSECCDPSSSGYPDVDGDGVSDVCDLDNDNDGILNTEEGCYDTEYIGDNSLRFGVPTGSGVVYISHSFDTSTQLFKPNKSNVKGMIIPDSVTYMTTSGITTSYNASGALNVTGVDAATLTEAKTNNEYLQFKFKTVSTYFSGFLDWFSFYNNTNTNPKFTVTFAISNDGFVSNSTTLGTRVQTAGEGGGAYPTGTRNTDNDDYYLDRNTTYTVRIYFYNLGGPAVNLVFDDPCIDFDYCVDTDGDGLVNSIDLDSDNDGCPDAIEGAENVTNSMLTTAGGILKGGNGVDPAIPPASGNYNQSVLLNLGNTIDAQGVPTIVNKNGAAATDTIQGQGKGHSQDALLNSCKNYWIGTSSTVWDLTGNWTAQEIPFAGQDVEFATNANNNNNPAVNNLYVPSGVTKSIGSLINQSTKATVVPAGSGLVVGG
ncbi:MAG: thrombospondin type 3 repeat-containing protein, partial [Paludibacteraceae bacterium]